MGAMRAALGDREWDVVHDVSGFVMAAGGSDIGSLIELLDGRVGSYVFCSSIMAYDQSLAGTFPWREDQPSNRDGVATYGGFKAFAERLMMERHAATGFPASVVRPAAIYGPENNIYDMETPMFLRLLQSRPVIVPHGGLVAGSYGHVDDLCELMVTMAELPAARGEIFNVTADGVTSMRYVTTLAEIVGVEPDIVLVPDDLLSSISQPVFGHLFGVRHHAIASIEKAASLLGFRPRFDFTSGHRATYEWFREQGWDETTEALRDPVWGASWDFQAEAELAGRLR
jgi:nucleoside-diphosphate-sugar epimerase